MPRARWLKPEFFKDRKMAQAGPVAALVYQALWVIADDGGMAVCDPDRLKGEMFFAWGAIGVPEITDALRCLLALGRIAFYKGSDELLCQIIKWDRHQQVHKPSKFRYREQYEDFSEVVPEWCGTGEALVPDSPPPRLLDSKTPRLQETQLHGGASRRTGTRDETDNSGPTFKALMGLVRKHLYVPDGEPPVDWDISRDGSILKALLKQHGAGDVAIAIEGLALVRDFPGLYGDAVTWRDQEDGQISLPPRAKTTLRALYGSKSGVLPMFTLATQAYWKQANSRSDAEATKPAEAIGGVVQRVMTRTR